MTNNFEFVYDPHDSRIKMIKRITDMLKEEFTPDEAARILVCTLAQIAADNCLDDLNEYFDEIPNHLRMIAAEYIKEHGTA